MANDSKRRVTFIAPGNELVNIDMLSTSVNSLCAAARTLKARRFIVREGDGWSVYSTDGADPNGGGPRQWAIRDPVRTMPNEDAAVMWALMQGRR